MPEIPQDLKVLERQVLAVIAPWDESRCRRCGWPIAAKLKDGCTLEVCRLVVPNDSEFRRADTPPNLSDPSTFWPMFEAWVKTEESVRGFKAEMINGGMPKPYSLMIQLQAYQGHCAEIGDSMTEAGIKAWHQALVALGKIKA